MNTHSTHFISFHFIEFKRTHEHCLPFFHFNFIPVFLLKSRHAPNIVTWVSGRTIPKMNHQRCERTKLLAALQVNRLFLFLFLFFYIKDPCQPNVLCVNLTGVGATIIESDLSHSKQFANESLNDEFSFYLPSSEKMWAIDFSFSNEKLHVCQFISMIHFFFSIHTILRLRIKETHTHKHKYHEFKGKHCLFGDNEIND